jgi:tRNA A-37 threonylcarbamoyl transferase component Bud32
VSAAGRPSRANDPRLGRGGPPCPPRDLAFYVDGLVEGRRGTLVQDKGVRQVWRVEESGEVWFAKRGVTPKRRREIRREAENARRLFDARLGPEVIAAGEDDTGAWIVTTDAGSNATRMIERIFAPDRRKALALVARSIRSMHDRGISTPDLILEHVFVADDGLRLIDPARVEFRPPSAETRARDLAALLFSSQSALDPLSRLEGARLVRDAARVNGRQARVFWRRIGRHVERLADKTRWRRAHWTASLAYSNQLAKAAHPKDGVKTISGHDFLTRLGATVVRTLPDRENRTLGRDDHGRPLFFVKIFPPTKSGWSPAMREIAAIDLFQRAGVLVNRLAAYAEDVDKGSMVAVKAARGEPLDDLLRRGVTVAERRALAVQTARVWRRMRECGLRHRDAYPCHLFVAPWGTEPIGIGASAEAGKGTAPEAGTVPGGTPRFELRLIDLTRAGRAPFPKERWFVKDAAALWHGLPKPPVTRTDAVRWLREYFRIDRLDARAKRFARRVAAKEARIAARQKRKSRR